MICNLFLHILWNLAIQFTGIQDLEKGKYNPSLVLAWNIAKVFHVTIEEIFTVES